MPILQFLSSQPWVESLGWTLVHFLWQGLLIAGLYAALSSRHSPRVRYALGCVALAAMLAAPVVTFTLIQAPASLTPPMRHNGAAPAWFPTAIAAWPDALPTATGIQLFPTVVLLWFTGVSVILARLIGGCVIAVRLRSTLVRPAPPEWQRIFHDLRHQVGVSRPVRLLLSTLVQAPAVIGWLRPAVLVPVEAITGLPADQLKAVLIHELAHIRRYDYLVNVAQGAAEALLFYHPAVWWLSSRIRADREMCCDDVAVALTGDALNYARALAQLASMRPIGLVVAANGRPLADRVSRLLGVRKPASGTLAGSVAAVGAIFLAALFGQSAALLKFEVASIKLTTTIRPQMIVSPRPGGRFVAENAPAQLLIINAFSLPPSQIAGGPGWINTDRFDIEAKGDPSASREQLLLMLRSLLKERFHLKTHRETKNVPVYTLAPARRGLKLPPPKEGACVAVDANNPPSPPAIPCGRIVIAMNPGNVRLQGGKVPMSELARTLTIVLGRPVLDKTGFTGAFDVDLTFAHDLALAGLPSPPPEINPSAPTIFSLQEQLGIQLGLDRAPVEVLVIDHIEKPSAN